MSIPANRIARYRFNLTIEEEIADTQAEVAHVALMKASGHDGWDEQRLKLTEARLKAIEGDKRRAGRNAK